MSSYLSTNMKRKDLELDHLDDDAFDFTLSSPARKIRRLDADLPPIIELGEPDSRFEQQPFSEFCSSVGGESRPRGLVIEELPPDDENQERAIVLFKPINTPLFHSPSNFVVDSNLLSSIKDEAVWEMINSKSSRSVEEKVSKADERLAVIPWVPSQQVLTPAVSEMEVVSDPMDAEEMGDTMEAEENIVGPGFQSTKELNQPNWSSTETVSHQWQQQHCIVPQPPHNTTSPVGWYR